MFVNNPIRMRSNQRYIMHCTQYITHRLHVQHYEFHLDIDHKRESIECVTVWFADSLCVCGGGGRRGDIVPHTIGPGINSNVCTLWTMHGMCLHTCACLCVLTPAYVYIGTSGTIPIILLL